MNVRSVIFLLALFSAPAPLLAQETPSATPAAPAATGSWAPDRPEPGSVEKIKEYTTAPEYLPESVAYVPDSDTVPSPTKALGHLAGAPDELSRVGGRPRLLPPARRGDRPRPGAGDRHQRGGARDARRPDLGPREPGGARPLQGRHRPPRRPAPHRARGGPPARRRGEGLLLAHRRPPFDRDRQPRDADGARLPAGGLGEAGDPGDPQEHDRHHHPGDRAGRPRPRRSTGTTATCAAARAPTRSSTRSCPRPTGATTSCTTTTATACRSPRRSPAPSTTTFYDFHPQVMHDLHESVPLLYIMTGYGPYNRAIDPVTISEWTQLGYHEAGDARRAGAAGGLHLGLLGRLVAGLSHLGRPTSITRWGASTRPSATARPAPSTATSRGRGSRASR